MKEGWYEIYEYESKESTINIYEFPHANSKYGYYHTNYYKAGDIGDFFIIDGFWLRFLNLQNIK